MNNKGAKLLSEKKTVEFLRKDVRTMMEIHQNMTKSIVDEFDGQEIFHDFGITSMMLATSLTALAEVIERREEQVSEELREMN